MSTFSILSNKSISIKLEIKKEQGFLSEITSFSSIFADYLFEISRDFNFLQNFESYFFYFNENNLKLIHNILKDKNIFENFEKYLESEFKIKCLIDSIKINSDVSTYNNYIDSIYIIINFKNDVFNIPSFFNLNEYVLNRYFHKFDYSNIFCSTDILMTTNLKFIFKAKVTISEKVNVKDLDNILKFNNTKFDINYTPKKTVFKGDIYEFNEDLKWIK